jgi:hypothetical protein
MRALRVASLLTGLGIILVGVQSDRARAAWPPKATDDLTNPANWPNDPDYKDRWNYFSWLPKQNPGTLPYTPADLKLGASGMSIDKAWTYTIGRPDTVIAEIDCGIEWESDDLVNKAWLNAHELAAGHRPLDKNGALCGGAGALDGYDCDGDGVFTVADYRDDPRIAPVVTGDKCFADGERTKPGPDRILGDLNRNCILDPGDLIELFSDGKDDDANGYVDDISGWDFFKHDNNPYDDTRYGHGTGEARDSSGEGNNGKGSIGVCPLCRFIPLRVADSYVADSNAYGKAVIYGVDNGVKVIQEALGAINQTPLSKAAMDYAYKKGVIVVASMADEDARHHNFPGLANHTMPVHTIRYDGQDQNTSTTFISYDTCSNYGGQLQLSISGTACSSEATGRAAGLAGLVYSMAASMTPPVKLSAEEVIQLLKMNADDIDVPQSLSTDPDVRGGLFESKPGWDQRFAYGRANIYRSLTALKSGLVPPEVDITSPEWFAPIYADRSGAQIAVVGRIAAGRAQSYDYKVEWGAGVEPDDDKWKPLIAEVHNVPASQVTGDGAPLALFDPRQLDTAHVRDPDSPHGENDRTITLRVRAVAHYPGGDVQGEARRAIAVTNQKNGLDEDLLPGFPIKLGGSSEPSPKLADVDGDGVRDIIVLGTDGLLHVWTLKSGLPVEVSGFPYKASFDDGLDPLRPDVTAPSYLAAPAYAAGATNGVDPSIAREAGGGAPAVGDIDGDGSADIVFTTWVGTIHAIDRRGRALLGFPRRLPQVVSCPLDTGKPKPTVACADTTHAFARGAFAAPVLVDFDGDKKLEIVQAAFDGQIHILHGDGTPLDGWPVVVHAPKAAKYNRIMSTPTVTDFNKDGIPDLATGSNETLGGGDGAGPGFIIDGRGNKAPGGPYLPNWPVTMTSLHLFPTVGEGLGASPAAGDFDGDGVPEVVLQGNGSPPLIAKADPGKQIGFADPPNRLPLREDGSHGIEPTSIFGEQSNASNPDTMFPFLSQPSIGDLDMDGTPDVITSGGSLSLAGTIAGGAYNKPFQNLLAFWSGKTGKMLPGSPFVIEDFVFFVNHAVADVSGDDYPETILGTASYFVHAVDAWGCEAPGWPKFTNGWHVSTPAVGDVDGDHGLEVVATTREGYVFAWKTHGRDDGVVQWESFHHDNQNTGDYGKKLDQGAAKLPGPHLDCRPATPPPPPSYEAGGCSVAPAKEGPGDWAGRFALFAGALGLAAAFARRKR